MLCVFAIITVLMTYSFIHSAAAKASTQDNYNHGTIEGANDEAEPYGVLVSLSDPVGVDKDGNELTLIDLLAEKEDSVFAKVEKSVQREKFVAFLKKFLSEREFVIISLRYGLEDGNALPQREVAKKLGISRSYISRIENRAIEKALENLKKDDAYSVGGLALYRMQQRRRAGYGSRRAGYRGWKNRIVVRFGHSQVPECLVVACSRAH